MANNARALQLKKNYEEFDEKLSDIKRLTGGLEKVVEEVLSSAACSSTSVIDTVGNLRVHVRYYQTSRPTRFELRRGGEKIAYDHQFDLEMVRLLHDNLDVLIELAESICDGVGRLAEFRAKMARFEPAD